MTKIMLNDILHLNSEQIANSKIGLNMQWGGKTHFEIWYESDEQNRNVDFTYHSHQGVHGRNRNFTRVGQWCFGFVRLQEHDDKWLLVSAGEITSIPDRNNSGACGHVELEAYQGLIGRLIISYHKGNKFARYIFDLATVIDEAEVSEILPNVYEPIKFQGFDSVHLSYSTLKHILEGHKYADYRSALQGVKGVYCLTDKKESKFYIGSAYGEEGILQRWSDYIDSMHGRNKALIELYNRVGESYFQENFEFTIIETFNKNTDSHIIIARESYWKEVFQTKENGYNMN
ncbi:MAG: GIY-YIG nuclease family protein [Clostridia bacterium]|nr:GIY-YIG nuclease family protein [Clostridia bacterium]